MNNSKPNRGIPYNSNDNLTNSSYSWDNKTRNTQKDDFESSRRHERDRYKNSRHYNSDNSNKNQPERIRKSINKNYYSKDDKRDALGSYRNHNNSSYKSNPDKNHNHRDFNRKNHRNDRRSNGYTRHYNYDSRSHSSSRSRESRDSRESFDRERERHSERKQSNWGSAPTRMPDSMPFERLDPSDQSVVKNQEMSFIGKNSQFRVGSLDSHEFKPDKEKFTDNFQNNMQNMPYTLNSHELYNYPGREEVNKYYNQSQLQHSYPSQELPVKIEEPFDAYNAQRSNKEAITELIESYRKVRPFSQHSTCEPQKKEVDLELTCKIEEKKAPSNEFLDSTALIQENTQIKEHPHVFSFSSSVPHLYNNKSFFIDPKSSNFEIGGY